MKTTDTVIATNFLAVVLAVVALYSHNLHIAVGSAFFCGVFFYVGIGMYLEEKKVPAKKKRVIKHA